MLRHKKAIIAAVVLAIIISISASGCDKKDNGILQEPLTKTDFMLGTVCTVKIYDAVPQNILDKVFERLKEIDKEMTINAAGSEVDEVNDNAGVQPVKVTDDVYYVIKTGKEFGSYERLNLAFQTDEIDDIAGSIADLIDVSNYMGLIEKIKSIPRLAKLATIFPRKVERACCQEVVEDADLSSLPVLKCWPKDGGRFITLPLVITRDPETGLQNMGMYRLQVYDKNTTGMYWHLHKDGRRIYEKYKKLGGRMPVSVAIGCDPATVVGKPPNVLNRYIDRKIDAKNPRTSGRHLPKGIVKGYEVIVLSTVSFALLTVAAYMLNPLCLELLPLAIALFIVYSFTKRFTWLCHIILGITCGGAPVGAWIAVTGKIGWPSIVLGAVVMLWVSGFDIIYGSQDYEFDKREGLFSIPVRFGVKNALIISKVFHIIAILLLLYLHLILHSAYDKIVAIYFSGVGLYGEF